MKSKKIKIQVNIPATEIDGYYVENYENGQNLWTYKGLDFLYLTDMKLDSETAHSLSINITNSFPSGFTINSIEDFNKWIDEDEEYRNIASMSKPILNRGLRK